MRPKGKPDGELYEVRKEALGLLEEQSREGNIDLFYGDETCVSQEGFVPYGWQFKDEQVCIEVQKGRSVNLFGMISRANEFVYKLSEKNINSDFIIEFLDSLSLKINRKTVLVLDNASIHKAKKVRELFEIWQNRGLYIFFLPPYSPQLNIAERLWKEIKEGWIKPADYTSAENLFYALDRVCANIGILLKINFAECAF